MPGLRPFRSIPESLREWTRWMRGALDGIDVDCSVKEDSLGNPSVNDYILSSKKDGTRSWVGTNLTALQDVVDDLTPQLGGDLDLNSSDITGTGGINITGAIVATSYGGITEANLLDKTVSETVSGQWNFSTTVKIQEAYGLQIEGAATRFAMSETGEALDEGNWVWVGTSADFGLWSANDASPHLGVANAWTAVRGTGTAISRMDFGNTVRILNGADFADFSHDGTNFITAFTNTDDWDLTGLNSGLDLGDKRLKHSQIEDYTVTHQTLLEGGTPNEVDFDFNLGQSGTIDLGDADLTGNVTLTVSNVRAEHHEFTLIVIQHSVTRSITWPTAFKWPGGTSPTLTTGDSSIDIIQGYTVDSGTTWYCTFVQDFS